MNMPNESSSAEANVAPNNGSSFMKYFKKKKSGPNNNGSKDSSDDSSSASSSAYPYLTERECSFKVGVAEDRNKKCRRTMEDAHTIIYNFEHTPDTGYFAVFDGHAGHATADWCSKKMHVFVENWVAKCQSSSAEQKPFTVSHALGSAFAEADGQIGKLNLQNSGCTAAVAVLRWENSEGTTSSTSLPHSESQNSLPKSASPPSPSSSPSPSASFSTNRRRKLYVANVGDTRVILCRGGQALRLTYDHKGTDSHESRRICNQGGIMMNNRVNGVLAVTRSLGDSYMKDLVTGAPYTTETELCPEDEFIIVACDGLWDVCEDHTAVQLIRHEQDPTRASKILVDHALQNFSSDNLTCMVIRLKSTEEINL